jgi:hypothetical protein
LLGLNSIQSPFISLDVVSFKSLQSRVDWLKLSQSLVLILLNL